MSSISEDEKLSQMIKDYIEIGSAATDCCLFPPSQVDHNPTYFSLQEIMEETPEAAEDEIYNKIMFYLKDNNTSMVKINILKKWIVFRLGIDKYEAYLCQTSWSAPFSKPPSSGFKFRGEYEYVEVMKDEMRVIVDIDFRRQFSSLARATPAYQQLINALPLVFVGTQQKLEKLISLICSAAKHSLKQTGLHIPPWRRATYMHSKWLSHNCNRLSFPQSNLSTNFSPDPNNSGCCLISGFSQT